MRRMTISLPPIFEARAPWAVQPTQVIGRPRCVFRASLPLAGAESPARSLLRLWQPEDKRRRPLWQSNNGGHAYFIG